MQTTATKFHAARPRTVASSGRFLGRARYTTLRQFPSHLNKSTLFTTTRALYHGYNHRSGPVRAGNQHRTLFTYFRSLLRRYLETRTSPESTGLLDRLTTTPYPSTSTSTSPNPASSTSTSDAKDASGIHTQGPLPSTGRNPTPKELDALFLASRAYSLSPLNPGNPLPAPGFWSEEQSQPQPPSSSQLHTEGVEHTAKVTSKATDRTQVAIEGKGEYKAKATEMADEDYASFLERANADYSAPSTASAQHSDTNTQHGSNRSKGFTAKTTDVSTSEIPQVLSNVEEIYISDADEEWKPVFLSLPSTSSTSSTSSSSGSSISEEVAAKLAGVEASKVETLTVKEFDLRGKYGNVVSAVEEAVGKEGKAGVKVFRVEKGGARCEYWVVGLKEGRVVGMMVGAVES